MYNPKDVFTEDGYEDYRAHLLNIERGLAYVMNHADDLHIGAMKGSKEDAILDFYATFQEIKKILKEGDGEKDDN